MSTIMVQGTSSGAGKTTIVTALCRIFSDMGYSVAPFKSQNMSRYSYASSGFEIALAQAVQAAAARCRITTDLNPVLLKPVGDYRSMVYLRGRPYGEMDASEYYSGFVNGVGIESSLDSLDRLIGENDLVVVEGAGSPAEINMSRYDIANMRIAEHAGSPVLLVADIERGGAFASVAGTMSLLRDGHRDLVKGFIFNKFRGDIGILRPGFGILEERTGRPVLGTVPMVKNRLPEEDSMGSGPGAGMSSLPDMEADIDGIADAVRGSVDVDAIGRMISWQSSTS